VILLFHDYTSPASAVAVLRAQRLADEGLPVAFEGIEAIGLDVALPVTVDILDEAERLAAEADALGLRLDRPRALPPTAAAHVLGGWAEQTGLGASWRETCYRAFWEHGVDLAARDALLQLAKRAGLDSAEAGAVLGDVGRFRELRMRTAARRGEGVGGVPTIRAHQTLVPGLLAEDDLRTLATL
jgi:predicted DsbA family dithiol-disulfide isomerase